MQIVEVKTKKQQKEFVRFPFKLYNNHPYWAPPLEKDELYTMSKENPVYRYSEARFFLLKNGDDYIGRIAAIINWREVKDQGKPKIRFGWFDVVDNPKATEILLQKVIDIGKENGLEYIEGPVGFNNLDKAGMLIKGFKHMNTMVTWYNYPYYSEHLEKLGYEKASEWIEFQFPVPEKLEEKVIKFKDNIMKRYGLEVIRFKNKKELLPYVEPMFELINETYKDLTSFVPISKNQIEHYKEKYVKYIDLNFLCCIKDAENKLVAFAITMPSYSKALQKAKGKLFPFGWYHLWRAHKKNDRAAFYLIGIKPEFQKRGITSIIFTEIFDIVTRNNIKYVETNPELEENKAVQVLWSGYNPELHKRRRTYKKSII